MFTVCCRCKNVCNETLQRVTKERMSIKHHVLEKQNRTSRQSCCVATSKLHVQCGMQGLFSGLVNVKTIVISGKDKALITNVVTKLPHLRQNFKNVSVLNLRNLMTF